MKHKFLIRILPLVVFVITSCSKDNTFTPDTSSNVVSATVSISGSPFQFKATGEDVSYVPWISGSTNFSIKAINSNNKLSIYFDFDTQTGTYAFSSNDGILGSGDAFYFTKDLSLPSQQSYWTLGTTISDKGSVTINVLNKHHIEGVFNAYCESVDNFGGTAQITNGSFNVNFWQTVIVVLSLNSVINKRLRGMASGL